MRTTGIAPHAPASDSGGFAMSRTVPAVQRHAYAPGETGDGRAVQLFGTADGYEAHRLQVTERHLFDRSWQAVQFAGDFKAES